MDELVVPFHAWGSFFDVLPGQSVKIEGPEDMTEDYQVVQKYLKGAEIQNLEICTEGPKGMSFAILTPAPHYWHFVVNADAKPDDKIMIPMEYNSAFATFNFVVVDQAAAGVQ